MTTDWRELVNAPEVDAVVVCTPNALHARQSIVSLEAGKHVLCEKPMATRVADGEEMLAIAARQDRLLLVLHPWRHHPAVIALRDAIVAGELGRVVRTHGYGVHADWGPAGWFTDPALAGGGALVDMGIHAIDTARFLLGEPDARRVRASITTAHGGYAVDDDGLVLIEWEGGARSLVESGWWQPHLGGHEADTEVYGSAGYRRIWARVQPAGYVHCDVTPLHRADARRDGQIAPGSPERCRRRTASLRCASASRPTRRPGRGPPMPADRPLRVAGSPAACAGLRSTAGLLRAAIESAPVDMTIEPLEIRELPLYDADLDVDGGPDVVRAFKAGILAADGLLIATPEYNYSLPGVLKNALDWASRAPERALQRQARRDRRRHARALGDGAQPDGAASGADVPGVPGPCPLRC